MSREFECKKGHPEGSRGKGNQTPLKSPPPERPKPNTINTDQFRKTHEGHPQCKT